MTPLLARLSLTSHLLRAPILAAAFGLSACVIVPQTPRYAIPLDATSYPTPSPAAATRRVAILLPLTGANAELGQAMLKAAQLALDQPGSPILDQRDTKGTADGAAAATRDAIAAGDGLILGPLTAAETLAATPIARAAGVPVLAFTSDATLAQPGIWTLGITPAQQMRRLVPAIQAENKTRIAAILPQNPFGEALGTGLLAAANEAGLPPPDIRRVRSTFPAFRDAIKSMANSTRRRAAKPAADAPASPAAPPRSTPCSSAPAAICSARPFLCSPSTTSPPTRSASWAPPPGSATRPVSPISPAPGSPPRTPPPAPGSMRGTPRNTPPSPPATSRASPTTPPASPASARDRTASHRAASPMPKAISAPTGCSPCNPTARSAAASPSSKSTAPDHTSSSLRRWPYRLQGCSGLRSGTKVRMSAPLPIRTAFVLGAVPTAVLLVLASFGYLAWRPAFVGTVVVLGAALVVAQLWVRDLARVIHALHRAAPGGDAAPYPGPPLLSATAHIAREAERLSRALAQREAEIATTVAAEQALVQRLPDPLIVLGPTRAIHRTNAAAESAFGPAIPAVLRHPGLRAAIDRALAGGNVQLAELSLPVPVLREVSATVIPLERPLADGGRIVAVLSDRTRERAIERMRADFVANASHELRTPLASLIGFIETIRGPAADDHPAQIRFLAIMAEQAQRMNRLIDDLLSLSRIELTEHQLPADEVDFCMLIRRLSAAFEPQSRAHRMSIEVTCPTGLPHIQGDEDQLEQVLQNLVDNAVKYGKEGGTIHITVAEAPAGKPWPPRPGIALTVKDDGQGIARSHIPRLTERFYRADKHRSRAVGGTGLGLAIVKHIINRHRGQLSIESTEGHGTTVTIWLPVLTPSAPPVLAPQGTAAAARA